MPNTLIEFPMVFLPQASPIWHLVFMFFLPPPPTNHSHLPFSINCSHFISPLFYTYPHFLPSFLHPPFPPIVSQPPASILFCSFYGYPLATTHYLISNYHCFPPPSPWIAHPIPLPLPVPLNPPNYICGTRNGFSKPNKLL
jgi:hypothetical protein